MLVLSFVLRVGGKTDLRQGMVTSWLSLPGCGWRCSRPSQTALKGGRGRVSLLSLGAAGGQGLYFPLWSRVFQTAGLCLPPQNEVPEAGSMLMSSLSPPGALSNATSEDPPLPPSPCPHLTAPWEPPSWSWLVPLCPGTQAPCLLSAPGSAPAVGGHLACPPPRGPEGADSQGPGLGG